MFSVDDIVNNPLVDELYINIVNMYENNFSVHGYILNEFIDMDLTNEQYHCIRQLTNDIELMLETDYLLEIDCGGNVYTVGEDTRNTNDMFTTMFNDIDNALTTAHNNIELYIKLLISEIIKTVNPDFDFIAVSQLDTNNLYQQDTNNDNSTDSVSVEV